MTAQYTPHQMAVIGKRLKDMRVVRGFSQAEVARNLGLSHSAGLCGVELGRAHTQLVLLLPKLCQFYKVDPGFFTDHLPPAPATAKVPITARDVMKRLDVLDERMARLEALMERLVRTTEGAAHARTR